MFHAIECMMERNQQRSFSLLVKGLNSYSLLLEKLKRKVLLSYKSVYLLTSCEENG